MRTSFDSSGMGVRKYFTLKTRRRTTDDHIKVNRGSMLFVYLGIFTNWADGTNLNEHHLQPTAFAWTFGDTTLHEQAMWATKMSRIGSRKEIQIQLGS